MPARDDHGSGTAEAGGNPHEPLVDRQLELDLLRQHIARVIESGNGHAVLILGESGVGKSRLAVEAAAEARQRGMTVISVRCLGRGAEPLLPMKEALASYLGRLFRLTGGNPADRYHERFSRSGARWRLCPPGPWPAYRSPAPWAGRRVRPCGGGPRPGPAASPAARRRRRCRPPAGGIATGCPPRSTMGCARTCRGTSARRP